MKTSAGLGPVGVSSGVPYTASSCAWAPSWLLAHFSDEIAVDNQEYSLSAVDWQLLFELRLALLHGKPLPLTTLRLMRARGWVDLPPKDEWVPVRAVMTGDVSQETIEAYSYTLAKPIVLPVGRREIALFTKLHPDDDIEVFYAEEMDDAEAEDDE